LNLPEKVPAMLQGPLKLYFITPTIIDPAGNRVHSGEQLPFDAGRMPPQSPPP
jgi:hypothetical protein